MMRRLTIALVLPLVFCVLLLPARSAAAETSQSIGYRAWLVDWEGGPEYGDSILHMLYYDVRLEKWGVFGLGGYGSGWKGGTSRFDAQAAVTRGFSLGPATARAGVGWHYVDLEFDKIPTREGAFLSGLGSADMLFHGPELSASVYMPFGSEGWGGHLTGTILPAVRWDYSEASLGADDDHGTTTGYSFDIGCAYTYELFTFSLGYRLFEIEKDTGTLKTATTIEESMGGLYVQVGRSF